MKICIRTDFWSYISETILWKHIAREWISMGYEVMFLDRPQGTLYRTFDESKIASENIDLVPFVKSKTNDKFDVYLDYFDFSTYKERPVNCQIRSGAFCWGLVPMDSNLVKDVAKNISPLFVCGNLMYNHIKKVIPLTYLLNFGIDHSNFGTIKEPIEELTKYKTVFLWIGMSVPSSCPDIVLSAYYKTFKKEDDVLLVMIDVMGRTVGLSKEIISHLKLTNIPNTLFIVGGISPSKVSQYIQSSTALVLPIRFHCECRPVLETMACGKLVITTQYGGPADYTDNSCAIYIDYSIENAIVSSLELERTYHNFNGNSFCSIYQGKDPFVWAKPSLSHLQGIMWNVHNRLYDIESYQKSALNKSKEFSWKKVARNMIEVVESYL